MTTITTGAGYSLRMDIEGGFADFNAGTVQSVTSTEAVVQGAATYTLSGKNFSGDNGAGLPTKGRIDSFLIEVGGSPGATLSGFSIGWSRFLDYAADDDFSGFSRFILDGRDTIIGHTLDDYINGYKRGDLLLGGGGDDKLFGGGGGDELEGGSGDDELSGGGGRDSFRGEEGGDRILGGGGRDTIHFAGALESTSTSHDTLVEFNADSDRLDVPVAVTDVSVKSGSVSAATFDADMGNEANDFVGAILIAVTSGDLSGHLYLVVDLDGTLAYEAGADLVMDITGFTGTLDTGDFI
jgi:Ca2+-binding RTX toxin-like protein